MKHCLSFLLAFILLLPCSAQERAEVLLETTEGNIRIELYNETPQHRDNFMKLVKMQVFDSLLFHRVIKDFMIQGGNNQTRQGTPSAELLALKDSLNYTIEPEFRTPQLFHKRGTLAAAREGDDVNPGKRSSATQFYFVWGRKFSQRAIEFIENRMTVALTPEMKETYMTYGGTPHLDGAYTVFGEITEGLEVVERIQNMATDEGDHPLQPVMILRTTIVREQ